MTPEFAYILKVNVAFVLFYAFYRLFFHKDTYFKLRRFILLIFFGLAFLYPLMNFQKWIMDKEPIAEVIYLYSMMLPEAVIEAEASPTIDWWGILILTASGIYWLTFGFLLLRFFVRLGSIIWLAIKSKRAIINGTNIHFLEQPSGPFSFFRLIFLHPESHSETELDEILTHERTHVSQWHSCDVVISELVCIICWMNPFVWLLKREIRYNLEYLADNTVLKSGYDSKSYQYHLLGLAHHSNQAAANLYNNFNVLHLKNRIRMMNKKRSRDIGRTKYLIFLPLVAVLLLLSNIEAIARITKDLTANTLTNEKVTEKMIETHPLPLVEENSLIKDQTIANGDKDTIPKEPFTVVDDMPRFPGGETQLMRFITKEIKYPVVAQKNKEQGRVICTFTVTKEGKISDIKIIRGVSPSLDAEAIRVVNSMPLWEPGKINDEKVDVKYTLPVTFRLQKENATTNEISDIEAFDPKDQVFTVVERMPQFPGGEEALLKFISSSIKYPKIAQENGIQGRVICDFIVNTDGSINDIRIVRGVDPSLDQEALRVLSESPQWTPGTQRGKAVRVKYTVPITFRIEGIKNKLDEVVVVSYSE